MNLSIYSYRMVPPSEQSWWLKTPWTSSNHRIQPVIRQVNAIDWGTHPVVCWWFSKNQQKPKGLISFYLSIHIPWISLFISILWKFHYGNLMNSTRTPPEPEQGVHAHRRPSVLTGKWPFTMGLVGINMDFYIGFYGLFMESFHLYLFICVMIV